MVTRGLSRSAPCGLPSNIVQFLIISVKTPPMRKCITDGTLLQQLFYRRSRVVFANRTTAATPRPRMTPHPHAKRARPRPEKPTAKPRHTDCDTRQSAPLASGYLAIRPFYTASLPRISSAIPLSDRALPASLRPFSRGLKTRRSLRQRIGPKRLVQVPALSPGLIFGKFGLAIASCLKAVMMLFVRQVRSSFRIDRRFT